MEDPTAGAWPLESYRNSSHISAAVQLINHQEAVVIVVNLRTLLLKKKLKKIICFIPTQLFLLTRNRGKDQDAVQERNRVLQNKIKKKSILNKRTTYGLKTCNALNFQ